MKKYFLKIAVYLLLLALPLTLIFAYVQSKPTVFSGTLLGTICHKSGLLDEVGSPRIIFVGGSSCPYATDCERISEELGMPCINLGVTSYFGLAYYRNLLKGHIGEGDIIVLMPEAAMMRNKINYEALWEGVENRPSLLRAVPVSYWKNMALAYYKYAAHKLDLLDAGYGKKGEIYSPDFGYFGDVTQYREAILEHGYMTDDEIMLNRDMVEPEFLRNVRGLAKDAEKAGAVFVFAFPPVDKLAVISDENELAGLESYLRDEINTGFLNTLNDSLMEGQYFYNSNNHLTTEGEEIYTETLIRALKSVTG